MSANPKEEEYSGLNNVCHECKGILKKGKICALER
jgi:hypothetical protein